MSLKIGGVDVLVRSDLEGMIDLARQHVRETGLPKEAADRVQQLGFMCSEHGSTTTVVFYRAGLVFVACRDCEREIVVIAVADSVQVLPAVESSAWN